VLVGGGNLDGPNGYWDNAKPMCQGTPYRSVSFLGDRPAVLYALHASRGPTLIYNGLEDTVVAIPRFGPDHLAAVRQRVIKLRGTEEGLFEIGFVEGASHRPWFVTKPVAQWFERHLDLPNWTAAEIVSMSETHIAEWAVAEEVEMDPRYSTEHREGGARALGTGIPGLSRKELSVFSPQEWERHKDQLIYERWVEAARRQ
ncbi:MAG: acetylxylan esterase, partial [bacterium]|nr:acetylxylan esterase [bacterium]